MSCVRMQVSIALMSPLVLLLGCGGGGGTHPPAEHAAEVLDGAHNGVDGFYFLPPLVPQPTFSGTFQAGLEADLRVDVVLLEAGQPTGDPVVQLPDPQGGTTSETIRCDEAAQLYIVNFHTDQYAEALDDGAPYRMFVRRASDDAEYGFADVQLFTSMKEAKGLTDGSVFALKDGRTLPVKFRIEVGTQPGDYKIAFISDRSGSREVYVMNSDGSAVTKVATGNGFPEWSPDCKEIAYARRHGSNEEDIYITNFVTGEERPLLELPHRQMAGGWSPRGMTIAYVDNARSPYFDVCIVNLDDPAPQRMTLDDGYTKDVHWSPTGDQLIYTRGPVASPASSCIEIMDVETLTVRKLPQDSYSQQAPDFSPDGRRIVFGSTRWGSQDIFLMNADGTNVVPLAADPNADEVYPRFSPDSTRIAFESDETGDREVYVIDVDGTNCVRLTFSAGLDTGPAWSPLRLPRVP